MQCAAGAVTEIGYPLQRVLAEYRLRKGIHEVMDYGPLDFLRGRRKDRLLLYLLYKPGKVGNGDTRPFREQPRQRVEQTVGQTEGRRILREPPTPLFVKLAGLDGVAAHVGDVATISLEACPAA